MITFKQRLILIVGAIGYTLLVACSSILAVR